MRALLAGISRSPLPGMTLFIKPLSEPKSELTMLTALSAPPSPAPPRPGMGSGPSARNGCWGAAAATPAPSPMVAIAASAAPMPTFIGTLGVELSVSQTYSRTTEFPSSSAEALSAHQTLQSLWKQCCSNVTGTTRHDHGTNSIDLLSNLGVCLLISPRYQPAPFSRALQRPTCTVGADTPDGRTHSLASR